MDPYLGPLASALIAAACAGSTLGFTGLGRAARRQWQRLRGRAQEAAEETPPTVGIRAADHVEAVPFRHARWTLIAGSIAGAIGLLLALVPNPGSGAIGATSARGVPVLATATLEGALTVALALVGALAAAGAEWLLLWRLAPAMRGLEHAPTTLADLLIGARGLLPWKEPDPEEARIAVPYMVLFVSAALPWSLVFAVAIARSQPGSLLLFGAATLLVPLGYAAAAERSRTPELARLRQGAAARQLAASPAWGFALLAGALALGSRGVDLDGFRGQGLGLAHLPGALAFLVAGLPALPGTSTGAGLVSWPWGGDAGETSRSVRALTGLAHYAWLAAWAAMAALLYAGGPGAGVGPAAIGRWTLVAMAALALLVLLRAAAAARGGLWISRLALTALPLALLDAITTAGRNG